MKTSAVLLLLLAAGTAMAQSGGQGGRPSTTDFISRLDKDGDGKVSASEFDGPSEHFTQLDKNSDGYISSTEVPSGPPGGGSNSRGGMNSSSSGFGRGGMQSGMNNGMSGAEFVKRLDKDGDNKVSQAEFDGPSEHFSQLDKNRDGYLSADEAPSGPPPRGGGNRN